MSNQENILQQAKSGNPNAISMLLNKSLTAKGITIVKHELNNNCLTLLLESDKLFNSATQSKIVSFIESNLVKLDVIGISSVVVCGKLTTENQASWQKEFSLVSGFDDIDIDDNIQTSNNDQNENNNLENANNEDHNLIIQKLEEKYEQDKGLIMEKYHKESEKIINTIKSINKEIEQNNISIKNIKNMPPVLNFIDSGFFGVLMFILVIFIFSIANNISSTFLYIVGILMIIIYGYLKIIYLSNNPKISQKRKLESTNSNLQQKKTELDKTFDNLNKEFNLKLENLSSNLDKDKAIYECQNFKTNLANLCLEEFMKVNARLDIGVSYVTISEVIAPAKLAVTKFEKSSDYNVCPYLSDLIKKTILCYQLSAQGFKNKVENNYFGEFNDAQIWEILRSHFDNVEGESVIHASWQKAGECTEKIAQILN